MAGDPAGEGPRRGVPSLFSRRLLQVLVLTAAAVMALALVHEAGRVLLLVFAGTLFALFLSGAARWLSAHTGLGYGLSLVIAIAATLGGTAGMLVWIGPRVIQQVAELVDGIPATVRELVGAQRLSNWLHELARGGRQGLMRDVETALSTFTGVVSTAVELVAAAVVFLFLGIYGAAEPSVYRRGLLRLVPLPARPRADQVLSAVIRALRRWLFGRVVAMLFVGAATTIGFWVLDIPVALALGLLAGLLSFIEYIGTVAAAAPALLLAADKGLGTEVWVLVLFAAIHALEGYLLTPFLARRTVRFPPGFTLAVQLLFGVFFGLVGLMLATPATVVLLIVVQQLYVRDVLGDTT